MSDITAVLTAFREELIAAGLVRRPSEAGVLPPMHIEAGELPAPGQAEGDEDDAGLVIGLRQSGDAAPESNLVTWRQTILDVQFRALGNANLRRVYSIDAAIRARLIRPATNYGYGFMLGTAAAVYVQQVSQFGGLGPISREPLAGSTLFDHAAKWLVEVPI